MPKKAAAPAAGAGGDAPAKAPAKSEKAEKPAAPVVDDKKAKAQPKQEEKPHNTKGEKAQEKPQGKGKGKQPEPEPEPEPVETTTTTQGGRQFEPDDDVEKEIKSRISHLEAEIKIHRDELDDIRNTIDAKKQSQNELKENINDARGKAQKFGDAKTYNDQYEAKKVDIQKLQSLQKAKIAEQKSMRQQLGGNVDQVPGGYLKHLEGEIRALQDRQASGEVGKLLDEKKIVAEIGRLNNNKKLYKAYLEVGEAINQYDTDITALRAEQEKIKEDRKQIRDKRKEFDDVVTESRDQQKINSDDIDKAITRRKELNDKVTDLKKKVDGCYDEMRNHRTAKREKAKAKRDEEKEKKAEDRRQLELKRQKEEEERGCYAEELEACTQLLQYLEPFKFRAPEIATEEAGEEKEKKEEGEKEKEKEEGEEKEEKEVAPATPPPNKRGGKKKQQPAGETDKEKELKHDAQTFLHFETLSLVAPQKVGDVEDVMGKISQKQEYLQKREVEIKAKRKANGTQE